MIDLHCHILPGIDDGAGSLGESLAMARCFVADGITHVVATPHCHREWWHLRDFILPRVERLNDDFRQAGIDLRILPGSEIQAYDTDLYRRDFEAGAYCHLGDRTAFTLIEFPWRRDEYPADAAELIAWIVARGTTPILAHPERHPHFADEPDRLRAVVDAGAWIQITADSLFGNHGTAARAAAGRLLRDYRRAVVSTDSHNTRRCSGLSPAFAWVRDHLGVRREEELRENADVVKRAIAG